MQDQSITQGTHTHGLEDLIEKTRGYIHAGKAPATLRAYRSDFEDFTKFCKGHNLAHLPATPTTVALYIADRAGFLRSATITRRLTSITKAHQAAGFEESPSSSHHFVVGETLKGIRCSIGTAQEGRAPLLTSVWRQLLFPVALTRHYCYRAGGRCLIENATEGNGTSEGENEETDQADYASGSDVCNQPALSGGGS